MNPFKKMKQWLSNLPNKKHHVEFLTAILSVPVLLTVVYMNYLSIQEKRNEDKKPTPTQSVVTIIREKDEDPTPTKAPVTEGDECKAGVGAVEIVSPEDEDTISDNPLEIDVEYTPKGFCAVVWSYRINESKWSDYSDRDIVIYNMPSGDKKLQLRVKSIVNGAEKTFDRSFTYKNTEEVPTPTPTSSPTVTPTIQPSVQGATATP